MIKKAHLPAASSLVACALAASLSLPAMAADFRGPVRIVVPFAPGGTSDILARYIAPELSDAIGQPVIVENKAGAGGNIGADFVAQANANGHTILLSDLTALLAAPSILSNVSYDIETDLAPVTMVSYSPYVMGVSNAHDFESFEEFIDFSLENPRRISVATSGVGANNHITTARLIEELGVEWNVIAYRGGSDATRAVVSQESDMLLNGTTATLPFALSGQMRALAVTGEARLAELPDVPTFRELGMPGELDGTYQGILVTAGSPPDVVERLREELSRIINTDEMKARIAEQGGMARTSESSEALGEWMSEQKAELAAFIDEAGIAQ